MKTQYTVVIGTKNLFDDETAPEIDETASAEKYAALVAADIQKIYPDIDIETDDTQDAAVQVYPQELDTEWQELSNDAQELAETRWNAMDSWAVYN